MKFDCIDDPLFLEFYKRQQDGMWMYVFILMDYLNIDASIEDPETCWLSPWASVTPAARLRYYEVKGQAQRLGMTIGTTKRQAYSRAETLKKQMIKEAELGKIGSKATKRGSSRKSRKR